MTTIKDYLIIILAFFAMVWLYESCHRSSAVIESVKTDTVYQTKVTSRWLKGNSIPYVIIATDTVHDSVQYLVHDTIRIVTDYMRTYAYSDTINVDSNTFVINDTISQNLGLFSVASTPEFSYKINEDSKHIDNHCTLF